MKNAPSTSPSRRSSRAWATALLIAFAAPAAGVAQQVSQVQPVLTIDQERLFAETRLGEETLAGLEREAEALASENAALEAQLIARERELTEQRAELPPDEFRALADAFDARVQQVRQEQDEKARALTRARDEARASFFNDVAEIISDIVREKGAVVVIDRRDVFLSADRIDITDEAIERVNAADQP